MSTSKISMDEAVREVEEIIGYNFNNKQLLEEALSHPSIQNAPSYERLEFLGDAALGLAVSKHIYFTYPELNQGELTNLRSANVSTERLARVALRRRLYDHLRRNCPDLDQQVKEFAEAVCEEDVTDALHGGSVKAPKGLADIVESIAAAVYVDTDFDLQKLWSIFRVLLEPLVTYEDLPAHPVTMLVDLCQKQGKKVRIKESRDGSESLASVYVDEEIVADFCSGHKETARLNAAKKALRELQVMPTTNKLLQIINEFHITDEIDGSCEIEAAQENLNILCDKMKWSKPDYREMKKEGPPHETIYVYSVQILENGDISYEGDVKSSIKDAKNSAASRMIHSLSDAQKENWIQVSNTKKSLFFYVNLAKRYMREFNEVKLSALGEAMSTVVTIAEILKNKGLAVEKKVATSSVSVKNDSKGRTIQKSKIEIVLRKTLNFDELMATAANEEEFEDAMN